MKQDRVRLPKHCVDEVRLAESTHDKKTIGFPHIAKIIFLDCVPANEDLLFLPVLES